MNAAQYETVHLLKMFFCSSVFDSVCVFNVWSGTFLLLPVWPGDAKSLDTLVAVLIHPFLRLLQKEPCTLWFLVAPQGALPS